MSVEWPSIADLLVEDGPVDVAILGAPMEAGSITPGRCDLAPEAVRRILSRFSTYDVETREQLTISIADAGDVPVAGTMPAEGFEPIRRRVSALVDRHQLTILLGGNNAITRPAVHGLGLALDRVGLITLDAHFDLRETDQGPRNGNPVRCLLEDGLPGRNIVQIGLAPFANAVKMHLDALEAGISVWTAADVRGKGMAGLLAAALDQLGHVDRIAVDFDIDVIDRAQLPGAPGARPGGIAAVDFFEAARTLAAEPRVRLVDLTELDPPRDVGEVSVLTAGRWVCETLSGFQRRQAQ